MVDPLIIIAAAGRSSRWGGTRQSLPKSRRASKKCELPLCKQLLTIDGEVLIQRTVRQLTEHFTNVLLMATDERLGNITKPTPETLLPGTALGHAAQFWDSYAGDSLIIFGDVYFSDAAMVALSDLTNAKDPVFFGRLGRDVRTGHGGEIFAIWLPKDKQCDVKRAIEYVIGRKARYSGWEVYKALNGFSVFEHSINKYVTNFVEHLDETDDFDNVNDLITWAKAYGKLAGNLPR